MEAPMNRVYVTVYHETQAYGGHEEGGWYYQQGEPVDGVYTICCNETGLYMMLAGWTTKSLATMRRTAPPGGPQVTTILRVYVEGHGEVATNGYYQVTIALEPPQAYPQERPHYE